MLSVTVIRGIELNSTAVGKAKGNTGCTECSWWRRNWNSQVLLLGMSKGITTWENGLALLLQILKGRLNCVSQ